MSVFARSVLPSDSRPTPGSIRLRGSARTRVLALAFSSLIACAVVGFPVMADEIRGRVIDAEGRPVVGARVTLIESHRSVRTDESGAYAFSDVPAGSYHVHALRAGLGSVVAEIELSGSADVVLALDFSEHRERIVVSANRVAKGTNETVHPVTVLEKDDLIAEMAPSLGEVLAQQPGISSTSFGQGASRPVIRGQQGSRVRVLESGLDVGDASSTSPDHAVSGDPFEAERIEVLRGPSVLLYGSSASGGVVNVIDDRVPEDVPAAPFGGEVDLRYGSAAEETSGGLHLRGGTGSFAWQAQGFSRDGNDYSIPGRAIESDPDSPVDTLPNSFVESDGGSVGASWVGDRGFLGVSYKRYDTLYGIPAALEGDESNVSIDLEQNRWDLRGGWTRPTGIVTGMRLQLGVTDYEHAELEGEEIGTRFLNDGGEGRLELTHGRGAWKGVVGVQATRREFEAIGEEAFIPPSTTDGLALFAIEEIEQDELTWELGLRLDQQDTSADGRPDSDYEGLSLSAGVGWRLAPDTVLDVSVTRSTRFPVAEELYSDGAHLATFSYELGDPGLTEETGIGFEVGLRHTAGRVTGQVDLFVNDYDDYIFETPTGDIEDDLPVFLFGQAGAEFYGYEASATFGLVHDGRNDLDLVLATDSVRAQLNDGSPLPLIPPRTHRAALKWRRGPWNLSAGVQAVEAQDRVAEFETRTGSYTSVDATAGYTVARRGLVHQFLLRGRNLSDSTARVHASRLKDFAPLPGRDLSLTYRVVF